MSLMLAAAAATWTFARAESPAPPAEPPPPAPRGLVVTVGYYFKGMMFYDNARGGPHATAGWRWRLPRRFGLWTGAGGMRSRGRLTAAAADGLAYRVEFEDRIAYGEAAVILPWIPFPIGMAVYRHASEARASDAAAAGGRALQGESAGWGTAVSVRLLGEWFPLGRPGRDRRGVWSVVLGYNGFRDLVKRDLPVRAAAGGTVFRRWSPLDGEGLQAGVTYGF